MEKKSGNNWIVYVSTFPPRECGIATFTQDLTSSIDRLYAPTIDSKIVAMNIQTISKYYYPRKVIFQIDQSHPKDYLQTANKINKTKRIKLVNIQHEFGIFGGDHGSYLIKFLEECKKPAVITFHTVLPSPNKELRDTVQTLAKLSKAVIVMTNRSKDILVEEYGLEEERIHVIPHGIHPVIYRSSEKAKSGLGLSKKTVLSTFGLLSKDKGIEYVLDALPEVIKEFPDLYYLIIGATHPVVRKEEGETYRNFLMQKVYDLGLTNHVRFYDKYLEINNLLEFLQATDVYISTSLNPNQAVSGTLSYALGTGRPIISTAFAQAKEHINNDVGILVDFRNPEAYKNAVLNLLRDPNRRVQMSKNAYFQTRQMTWPNIALSYMRNFSRYVPELQEEKKNLPEIKLSHLVRMTDNFGIIQFADVTTPDLASGYTIDDNSRALSFVASYYQKHRKPIALKLLKTYLQFIEHAIKPDGTFENYILYDRTIDMKSHREENLDDANARTLCALMQISTQSQIPKRFKEKSRRLFENNLNRDFTSPRAAAFFARGLYYLLSSGKINNKNGTDIQSIMKRHCDRLIDLYENRPSPEWEWFENYLTYCNSILPEALLLGYKVLGDKKYLRVGKKTLDFLIKQTFHNEIYMPIGQKGWYTRNSNRVYFDQQPEDVSSMVQTLKIMHTISKNSEYKRLMCKTFYWFLGDNILGQFVYDTQTGGCYDGIGEKYVNINQGAESTISYLLARLAVEE